MVRRLTIQTMMNTRWSRVESLWDGLIGLASIDGLVAGLHEFAKTDQSGGRNGDRPALLDGDLGAPCTMAFTSRSYP